MPSTVKKRTIQAEDLYRFQLISGTRLSPDGAKVAFALNRVDQKTQKKYSNLWLVSTDGSQPWQFTYGDQNDAAPRWSPDGKHIVFLSNRLDKEKPPQLFIIPTNGGEARQLTHIPGAIGAFSWSPDGKTLLCQVRKTDAEVLEREKDEQKKKLGVVARHYNRLFYKLDGFGYLPHERWHLWLIDTATGKTRQLTDHAIWDEGYPAWSPDGKSIVFISNHAADPDSNPDCEDLFILPINGEPRSFGTPMGSKSSPTFSPDGKWIAFYADEGDGLSYKNAELWIVPADGTQAPVSLTRAHDLNCSAWTINDLGEPEPIPPTWSKDGKTLYFPVTLHGSSHYMSISVDGKSLKKVIGENGVVNSLSFDQSQKHLAYFFGTMDDPGQIFLRDMASGKTTRLTRFNRDWLDKVDLGKVKEVWFKGPDQNNLQGWILTPPGFDPSRKYPSIMEIHGGPLTQYGWYFMHEFYYLAASGYVVYFCNPRGGRGYGEAHAGAIYGDWGNKDYADLMAWADVISREPYIDTQRMGVTGGSYGGYMTVWIVGHTQRFKAAVTQRCVSNFVSMWGSSDFNWVFQHELNNKAPFEDLQYYWDHSPIAYIGACKTPMKVLHNENDHRCPIEQGEQVYVALKRLGIDTEFVRFPEEFHGLSRSGRTDRRIARLNHIRSWFDKYIKS